MLASVSIAAATAVVKYDLMSDSPYRQDNRQRTIVGMALAGSAAAGDTEVDLFVGNVKVATMFNKATGFPTRDHLFPVRVIVPSGQEVHAYVVDAPTTNSINLDLDFA